MATFKAEKLDLTKINGGQEYEQGDFLQSDTINDVVEGTAYAQNVAEAANTKSDDAVSTANSANKTANAASAKVDTFEEDIATAQKTADRAVSNADTAQNTADSATTEINKIKNGTTVVPNANHANNADNANLATKAQQDVNGNPINTTYATVEYVDDLVTEKQGTRVTVNNVNVAELSFTSDPQTQITANKNAIAEAQSDINDIVDGSQTVGKAKQDANGNVINTTYAKLSQVVRVDAAQSLTDEQKQQAQENLALQGNATLTTPAWYKIATISEGYVAKIIRVKLTSSWGSDRPFSAEATITIASNSYSETIITTVGNFGHPTVGQNNIFSKIRLNGTNIEVYYNTSNSHTCRFEIEKYDHDNANITIYDFETTDQGEESGSCFVCDFVNGINTSGGVYQNGAPVFATDPSKLTPSTANGWTQTTATGTLPSVGVYMIAVHHTPSATQPHHYYNPAILVYDGTAGGCMVTDETGRLLVSITVTPSGIRLVNPVNPAATVQSTNIYYKRIA